MKKIPMRRCVGCGESKNKKELIRVIDAKEEGIMIDLTGKKNGRGAYLCRSLACFDTARKKKALERSLKAEIPKEIYEVMEKELRELESK